MEISEFDVGGTLPAFRAALKVRRPRETYIHDLGLHGLAMRIGDPGLAGFAPTAGFRIVRPGGLAKVAEETLESPIGASRRSVVAMGGRDVPAAQDVAVTASVRRQTVGMTSSVRAVMIRARAEAEALRRERAAARADLFLPPRHKMATGASFAPSQLCLEPVNGKLESRRGDNMLVPSFARGYKSFGDGTNEGDTGFAPPRVVADAANIEMPRSAGTNTALHDLEQALDEYFFRKSRLPPVGGAGFNSMLTPVWAGLKIPG